MPVDTTPTSTASAPAPRALTEAEAAQYTRTSRSYLRHARSDGARTGRTRGPAYVRLDGRRIRYLIEDLDQWLITHRVGG